MSLKPFFKYFGGKFRVAPKYPAPSREWLIEPFAGSAGYALRYPDRRVLLVEASEAIAGIWRYLVRASSAEIRRLPLLEPGQSVDTLQVAQEARWLIGMWVGAGLGGPRKSMCRWPARAEDGSKAMCLWGAAPRERIASQVDRIRHWVVQHGSYTCAPDIDATWFIDPPYQGMGRHYPHGSRALDYPALADWCRSRRGHVIVCENTGADWLPFEHFCDAKAKTGISREAVWLSGAAAEAAE